MNEKTIFRNVLMILLVPSILFFSIRGATAEQLLVKGDVEYLGKKIGDNKFETCNGKIIKIGDGEVVETNEKCDDPYKTKKKKKAKKAKKAM